MTEDGGCVLLSGRPVVWPAETTLTTDPPELHLPHGLEATPGDVITGGGGAVPTARISETALRIEGDLSAALECAPRESEVVVLTARGDAIRVLSRISIARASFENGYSACRWAHVTGRLARVVEHAHGDAVGARRLLDRLQHLVRANLRLGYEVSIALQGCLEAVWPEGVPLPRR